MRYLIPILGLLLLVFLHELGHFVAAKRTGMRALSSTSASRRAILRRQVGDTEYGIGAIPLGGFVKIPGMLRPEASDLWPLDDIVDRREGFARGRQPRSASPSDDLARLIGQGRVDDAAAAATAA